MGRRFGTDGIRGVAYEELTLELSFALGQAAVSVFGAAAPFVIGRDTRESGPAIQAALSAGLVAGGASVEDIGVATTPAIAYVSAVRGVPAAVISASHNPYTDNGIKFFAAGGRKLSDDVEARIETELERFLLQPMPTEFSPSTTESSSALETYRQHLGSVLDSVRLEGQRIVIDCANGASSAIAPGVLGELGADVIVLNASPDGRNINTNCGSTHPEQLQQAVVEQNAVAGFAFDGDADRLNMVDETGVLLDGDYILAMLALDARRKGSLKDNTLVVTVMSNLGLRLAMEREGIAVHETAVGDRYVLDALNEHGWTLGGEQSGHIILAEFATTGDGLLAALCILGLMKREQKPLSELAQVMTKLPQVLRNVRVKSRDSLEGATQVWEEVASASAELGKEGRVLLRASGTEPLVRVMVEAATQDLADEVCDRLCVTVERELGMEHA